MGQSNRVKKFVLNTTGNILPGFELLDVTFELSSLYKMSESDISKRLLSGKAVKIKSFYDLESAERLARKLDKIGLNCFIVALEPEPSVSQTSNASEDADVSIATAEESVSVMENSQASDIENSIRHEQRASSTLIKQAAEPKTKNSARKLKVFIVLLLVVFFSCVAYYFIAKWFVGETPLSVNKVESALFKSQKPSIVIHADMKQFRRLLSVVNDSSLEAKANSVLSRAPLIGSLNDSVKLQEATDFITAGATLGQSSVGQVSWLTVLQGRYSNIDLKAELAKTNDIETTENGLLILRARRSPGESDSELECPAEDEHSVSKKESPVYAQIGSGAILLSTSADNIHSYSQSLTGVPLSAASSLVSWQQYRSESIFATQIFDEKLLHSDFMARAASSAMLGESSYEYLGLRAAASPIKQALTLSFDAMINDEGVAEELAGGIKTGIDDLVEANRESYPSVVDVLSRVDVEFDRGLHLNISVDKALGKEIESVVSDFFGMMFSAGSRPSGDGASSEIPVEKLEEYAWDFSQNENILTKAELPSSQFDHFQPISKNGNAAIFLHDIGMKSVSPFDKELGDALQLTLKAKRPAPFGDAFFGWNNSGIRQRLSITQVTDDQGESLLVDERCVKSKFGQDLNHQPSESTNYSNGVIETLKSVRLREGATVNDIVEFSGKYELVAPVDVVAVPLSLDQPLSEWPSGTFTLKSISGGDVSYTLDDKDSRLLEVRGLNSKGQALSSASGFSSGNSYTKSFQGEVASVELMIAGRFEEQAFEFKSSSVVPDKIQRSDSDLTSVSKPRKLVAPAMFDRTQMSNFSKVILLDDLSDSDSRAIERELQWKGVSLDGSKDHELGRVSTDSAVVFFMHDQKSEWSHKLEGSVIFPHIGVLHFSDGLVQLKLTLDGKAIDPVALAISSSSRDGVPIPGVIVSNHELDFGTFSIPFEEQRPQIDKIEGELEYTLPTAVSVRTINMPGEASDLTGLTFLAHDFSWTGSTTYRLNDELAKAVLVKLTTTDGAESKGRLKESDGVTTVEFDRVRGIKKLDFYFISNAQTVTESFNFKPVYK